VAVSTLLVIIQMTTILHDILQNHEFDLRKWEHWALLRLLVAMGALITQVAMAAADIVYASERLAETLAVMETSLQVIVG